jgi:hypothetical protein
MTSIRDDFHNEWQAAAEREKRSHTVFAQETIKVTEVELELKAIREAIGSEIDVERFSKDALRAEGATISGADPVVFHLKEVPRALRDFLGPKVGDVFPVRFQLPVGDGVTYVPRTHPVVEGLASYVLDTALDPIQSGAARRAGAIRTNDVEHRTTALLLRFRFDLITKRAGGEQRVLAEECGLVAFAGSPDEADWLSDIAAQKLLTAEPHANVSPEQAREQVRRVIGGYPLIAPALNLVASTRAEELLTSHRRVRESARMTGVRYSVEAQVPPDVLGVYVFLPVVS